jgi:hypothetical protein
LNSKGLADDAQEDEVCVQLKINATAFLWRMMRVLDCRPRMRFFINFLARGRPYTAYLRFHLNLKQELSALPTNERGAYFIFSSRMSTDEYAKLLTSKSVDISFPAFGWRDKEFVNVGLSDCEVSNGEGEPRAIKARFTPNEIEWSLFSEKDYKVKFVNIADRALARVSADREFDEAFSDYSIVDRFLLFASLYNNILQFSAYHALMAEYIKRIDAQTGKFNYPVSDLLRIIRIRWNGLSERILDFLMYELKERASLKHSDSGCLTFALKYSRNKRNLNQIFFFADYSDKEVLTLSSFAGEKEYISLSWMRREIVCCREQCDLYLHSVIEKTPRVDRQAMEDWKNKKRAKKERRKQRLEKSDAI